MLCKIYFCELSANMLQAFVFTSLIIVNYVVCEKELSDNIDWCIDSKHHKVTPGPESDLFHQCSPWRNHSCCTRNISVELMNPNGFSSLYNFNLNHCHDKQEQLSQECHRHFVQDACFYHCEPNLGPWRVKLKRKIASERFYRVPLCESDCESWFNACKHDYTCVTNWPRNMNFTKDKGNQCPHDAVCRTFEEIYNSNASYFCNQVWDESLLVVPDNELCMRIWFDGTLGNPNEHTAREYVKIQISKTSSAFSITSYAFVTAAALMITYCWDSLLLLK